ncbi:MAG: hypothetical protein HC890_09660, partial [Chloroflexaceae bacterium]|nr:hypothetical protein [Chloroflexaceae bacterium]
MALASLGISFGDIILPQSNLNGEAATVEVTITNNGTAAVNETADLNLFSSVDDVRVSESDFIRDFLQTSEGVTLNLAPGASTTFTLDYDQVVNASPGSFYLIAELAEAGSDSSATAGVVAEAEHVSRPGTNVVIDWASAFLNATQVGQTLETAPPFQARNMGIVFPAIFDAINLIESVDNPQFSSIFVDSLPEGFSADIASSEAAAVGAAFTTLDSIYEGSLARLTSVGDAAGVTRITNVLDNLEEQFDRSIQELIDGGVSQEAIDAGLAIGEFVGNEILGDRADDGAAEAQSLPPLFEGENLNTIAFRRSSLYLASGSRFPSGLLRL